MTPPNPQMAIQSSITNQTSAQPTTPTSGSSPNFSLDELLLRKGIQPFKKGKVEVPTNKKSTVNLLTTTKHDAVPLNFPLFPGLSKLVIHSPNCKDASKIPSTDVSFDPSTISIVILSLAERDAPNLTYLASSSHAKIVKSSSPLLVREKHISPLAI